MMKRLLGAALAVAFLATPLAALAEGIVLLPSAARTATVQSGTHDLPAPYAAVYFIVDVSALAATPAVTCHVEVDDPASATWVKVFSAAAAITDVTGTGVYVYALIHPELTAPSAAYDVTESVAVALGGDFRLNCVHGDTDSITYSASYVRVPR